ncbi:unnamed protein product [Vitrella brassicaformis CCMP3155]|uniref:Uncharacterized protein n=1 Tax=Vitrella brassicaformis (strain CCMP3155) TaxID=1169540 RepID=A0A0G4H4V9_VITBC|nr:unnamed protein product [Vitrella brassicaformis CCMP3155]|eukprot:CEM38830.1 unnamed protein product [Vitrella brassicaformis CCMP3155]
MSDRVVGLLDGHFVYADGHGGYAVKVEGERVAIDPSFNRDIKPSVAGAKRRRQDDHNGPQQPAAAAAAAASDSNGITIPEGFVRLPTGAYHKVVEEGTGRVPTLNDRVKFDWIAWRDAFDGQNKAFDDRGWVIRVSDWAEWFREAMLSMREGEVRRIRLPDVDIRYRQLRLISIE